MEIHLFDSSTDIQLPVLPESFEITETQNNETVKVHTFGEVNLIGKRGLKSIPITSVLPASNRSYVDTPDLMDPLDYIKQFRAWKDDGSVITLTITETDINMGCTVEELKYSESDSTGDISYTLTLKEYRNPETRVAKKTTKTKYKVKSGDTLAKIAYKYLGKTSYKSIVYDQNKRAIESAFKKHQAKLRKAGKTQVKSRTSKKGKYLYKGTILYITKKVV